MGVYVEPPNSNGQITYVKEYKKGRETVDIIHINSLLTHEVTFNLNPLTYSLTMLVQSFDIGTESFAIEPGTCQLFLEYADGEFTSRGEVEFVAELNNPYQVGCVSLPSAKWYKPYHRKVFYVRNEYSGQLVNQLPHDVIEEVEKTLQNQIQTNQRLELTPAGVAHP